MSPRLWNEGIDEGLTWPLVRTHKPRSPSDTPVPRLFDPPCCSCLATLDSPLARFIDPVAPAVTWMRLIVRLEELDSLHFTSLARSLRLLPLACEHLKAASSRRVHLQGSTSCPLHSTIAVITLRPNTLRAYDYSVPNS